MTTEPEIVTPDAQTQSRLKATVGECQDIQKTTVSKEFSTPDLTAPSRFKYVITIEGLTSEEQMPPCFKDLDPGEELRSQYKELRSHSCSCVDAGGTP